MPDDAPVMRAYPALSAALPPPVGEGGEAEDNNFNNDEDGSGKVELFATNDTGVRRGQMAQMRPVPPPCAPIPALATTTMTTTAAATPRWGPVRCSCARPCPPPPYCQ